jgi:hypothetical protein
MSLTLLLALQAAAPAPASILAPIDFDLARLPRLDLGALGGPACNRADPNAIVVCGRRGRGTYPLDEMAAQFEPRPIRAETGLVGNLRGAAYLESVVLPGGQVSNRMMVGIRLPF